MKGNFMRKYIAPVAATTSGLLLLGPLGAVLALLIWFFVTKS